MSRDDNWSIKNGSFVSEPTTTLGDRRRALSVLGSAPGLPTVPTTVANLVATINSPDADAGAVEEIIRKDPALTANLLRLANSPYFGARRQIGSVRQAITMLGLNRVFDLAASAWFGNCLPSRLPGYDIGAKSFWLHCLAVGTLAEQLAGEHAIDASQMVFTAGLLHDVGKLAIGTLLQGNAPAVMARMEDEQLSFAEAETLVLGTDHTEVGECMIEAWGLPVELGQAVRWHHLPTSAPRGADQNLIDLVHVADNLAHTLGFGADVGELRRRLDGDALDRLLLDPALIALALTDTVVGQIWEMGEFLSGSVDV